MDFLEINDNICRICLEQNVILHWNDEIIKYCGTSYKDCYYKYTQLEIPAVDPFSQMLCQTCSIDLRNSHVLMVKALESHAILQQAYSSEIPTNADEYESTKEIRESSTGSINEPNFEPANFEIVIFNQPNEESSTDDDYDDLKKNDNEIKNEIPTENDQEKRKRICKRPNWLENGTFEVNIPKLNSNIPSPSSKEVINEKSKKIKKEIETKTVKVSSRKSKDNTPYQQIEQQQKENETDKTEIHKTETDNSQTPTKKKRKPRASRTYMCSFCSKICKNAPELLRHENRHKGDQERTEVCPQCGLKFWKKSILELHIKTHDLNRPKHKCEYCEKAYYNIAALNIHRRKHLGQMTPCPLCPKEFFRKVDLDRHNITAHSAASLHSDIKKMPKYMVYCKECNKHLRTTSWKAHQAGHLKEPLMKCALCDKEFFSRSTCTYHMDKTHEYKKREEYEPFIIYLKGRLSHLMLEQQAALGIIET